MSLPGQAFRGRPGAAGDVTWEGHGHGQATKATKATPARAAPVEAPAEQAAEQAAEGTDPSHCAAMPMSDAEVAAAKGSGEAGTVEI